MSLTDRQTLPFTFREGAPIRERTARDHFLVERYCMYADPAGVLVRADVHHAPWPLAEPHVRPEHQSALTAVGIVQPLRDVVHVCAGVDIVAWPAARVR